MVVLPLINQVHVASLSDTWPELLRTVKDAGMRAAVAIKPSTPVEDVFPLVRAFHSLLPVLEFFELH